MKRQASQRKAIPVSKKRQPVQKEPQQIVSPTIETVVNPASQAKLDLLAEKEAELEQVLQIKEKSDALVKCFNDLAEGITSLSKGAQGVSKTLNNWENVFGIMGEMKHNGDNPKWVRFEKSIITDNKKDSLLADRNRINNH